MGEGERYVERFEDMSPRGRLRVLQQEDGDMIVQVIPDPDSKEHYAPSAEFCTRCGGGGSGRTIIALVELMKAIEVDNEDNPQYRG